MNAAPRLTGVVSERPHEADPIHQALRELIAENERLIAENERLKQAGHRTTRFAPPEPLRPVLALGRLHLNRDLRLLSLDGRSVHIAMRGLEMIAYLMARPDRVIQTAMLAEELGHKDGNAARTLLHRVWARLAVIGAERYLRSHGRSWSGGGYWMSCDHEVTP